MWELASLAALVLFYFSGDTLGGERAFDFVNFFGPLALAIILLMGAVRAAMTEAAALWTGLLWFRISTAVYFGIGSIAHYVMNDVTLLMMITVTYVTPAAVAKFNLLIALSSLTVLATAGFLARHFPRRPKPQKSAGDERFLLTVALIMTGVGYFVKFAISLPASLGVYGDVVIPGVLLFGENAAPPGLFMLTLWCLRRQPSLVPLMGMLAFVSFAFGFLRFGKGEALLPLIMFFMAILYHRTTAFRLMASALIIGLTFAFMAEPVTFGREQINAAYGSLHSATLSERLDILSEYYTKGGRTDRFLESQGALARLSYLYSSAPVMDLYDRGIYGDSLQSALVIFIPRMFWPGKPVFDHGTRYSQLLYGNDRSSSWMGYFAEAYWNLGWPGVPLLIIPLGAAFFVFGRYAQNVLDHERWMHFPSVFLGMFLGARTDGSLIVEFMGTCLLAILVYAIADFATAAIHWSMLGRKGNFVVARPTPQVLRVRR